MVFPMFDQPDIKASWQLDVLAPKDWAVISNEFEKEASVDDRLKLDSMKDLGKLLGKDFDGKFTRFRRTPKIATYLYALVAG
jgi:aminopeptidase N